MDEWHWLPYTGGTAGDLAAGSTSRSRDFGEREVQLDLRPKCSPTMGGSAATTKAAADRCA